MIKMTPLIIELVLWYHTRVSEHPNVAGSEVAPAYREGLDALIANGVIEMDPRAKGLVVGAVNIENTVGSAHRLTERGEKFVEMLLNTPLPTMEWIDPRRGADVVRLGIVEHVMEHIREESRKGKIVLHINGVEGLRNIRR